MRSKVLRHKGNAFPLFSIGSHCFLMKKENDCANAEQETESVKETTAAQRRKTKPQKKKKKPHLSGKL